MGSIYWTVRERIRRIPLFNQAVYLAQSLRLARGGDFGRKVRQLARSAPKGEGVALCVRIRDEALNLREFVEYYLAAGIRHFFFYEARSTDDFHAVLDPFVAAGTATLIENWPHVPISPAAEHDCILRSIGRFAWVGFVDADEFVVIREHIGIDAFLDRVPAWYPALGLHWRYYGSDGHIRRPALPVIAAYTRRQKIVDWHVKLFARPQCVARYRNPHSWYYFGLFAAAVNEKWKPIYGSTAVPGSAEEAWINHYYHKSQEEFDAKGSVASIQDAVGMRFNSRTPENGRDFEKTTNEVVDLEAVSYHRALCRLPDCSICAAVGALGKGGVVQNKVHVAEECRLDIQQSTLA